eukprot:gnl/TRDRNA2_/TRDRNA2_166254_c0_seq4.p1 gnl/TRDRNA2_/TRDRNA2_166254_c0~~gnl/TRDRNA2_/TRDRNA2_166254_c0_seq4.p1  ORF type:complete len:197 (-),score=22.48 gnl/TRDRNA2_/TRDRNA2_166254_c0_seq4:703-1260(-)
MAPVALRWALLVAGTLPMESVPMNLPNATNLSNSSCPLGEVHKYLVDNTLLKSSNSGITYCNSKSLTHRYWDSQGWWTTVEGIDGGDGWLAVTDPYPGKYLPITMDGELVLLCNPSAEQLAAAEKLKIAAAAAEQQKTMWLAIIILGILPISVLCMCRLFHGTTCCGVGGDESYSPVDEEELDTQ